MTWWTISRRPVGWCEPLVLPTSEGAGVPVFRDPQDARRFMEANPEADKPGYTVWTLSDAQLADALERARQEEDASWVFEFAWRWQLPLVMKGEWIDVFAPMLRAR